MKNSGSDNLKSYINALSVIDTHEHIHLEKNACKGLFDYIGGHYAAGDFTAAGADDKFWGSSLTAKAKWERLSAFLPAVRTGSYWRGLERSFALFGFTKKLDDSNWNELDARIKVKSGNTAWQLKVLKGDAKIEKALLDQYWMPWNLDVESSAFAPVFRVDSLVTGSLGKKARNGFHASAWDPAAFRKVKSFDDYLQFAEELLAKRKAKGWPGMKCALAYERALCFVPVKYADATKSFRRGEKASPAEQKLLQDYLLHHFVKLSEKYSLPFQFHTGIQAGGRNTLANSNPEHLNNLLLSYDGLKMDIFHAGYPYSSSAILLAKYFPGARFNLCWMPLISSEKTESILNEALDLLPNNKIFWGGDVWHTAQAYGALLAAKETVFNTLSYRIGKGLMDLDSAKLAAKNIFYSNAKTFYSL